MHIKNLPLSKSNLSDIGRRCRNLRSLSIEIAGDEEGLDTEISVILESKLCLEMRLFFDIHEEILFKENLARKFGTRLRFGVVVQDVLVPDWLLAL